MQPHSKTPGSTDKALTMINLTQISARPPAGNPDLGQRKPKASLAENAKWKIHMGNILQCLSQSCTNMDCMTQQSLSESKIFTQEKK